MTTKEYIVCIDMDDTIENLCLAWLTELNKRHGTNVSLSDVKEWDIGKAFPMLEDKDIYDPLYTAAFWSTVTPKEDAIRNVKKLIDTGFTVYIVTNSTYVTVKEKFENVLFKYFPFIKPKQTIVMAHKQMLKCNILVDDYINNLVGGDYHGILYRTNHNKSIDVSQYSDIYDSNNWDNIYDTIVDLFIDDGGEF